MLCKLIGDSPIPARLLFAFSLALSAKKNYFTMSMLLLSDVEQLSYSPSSVDSISLPS